jgi:hypothetical protein
MASDLTAQDLAGLSPEDVSRALSGALAVENARQDIPYKQALTKQASVLSKLKNLSTQFLN